MEAEFKSEAEEELRIKLGQSGEILQGSPLSYK
jgi:hypothetical protein